MKTLAKHCKMAQCYCIGNIINNVIALRGTLEANVLFSLVVCPALCVKPCLCPCMCSAN